MFLVKLDKDEDVFEVYVLAILTAMMTDTEGWLWRTVLCPFPIVRMELSTFGWFWTIPWSTVDERCVEKFD